jgi:hypothetical protein
MVRLFSFVVVVVVMACIFADDWNEEEPRTRAEVRARRRLLRPLNASSADRYRRLRQPPKLLVSWAGFNGHLLRVANRSVR